MHKNVKSLLSRSLQPIRSKRKLNGREEFVWPAFLLKEVSLSPLYAPYRNCYGKRVGVTERAGPWRLCG